MNRLLDTNVCIAWLNGADDAVRDRLLACDPSTVFLCSVVKAELVFGARNSGRVSANLGRLADFFRGRTSFPFDDAAAEQYGALRAHLRRTGTPIGANDLLIASIALARGVTVVTRNTREFEQVPALAVEVW